MACENTVEYDVTFVASIPVSGSAATGTFDLTDDKWCVTSETRFNPPAKRRAEVQTLLTDGTRYPADIYENRTLELRLACEANDVDDLAAELQKLMKQLIKPNILKVKPKTTEAVYFKTFAVTPDEVHVRLRQQRTATIDVDLIAEYAGFGPEINAGTYVVSNNPAVTGAGVTGMYFDVTGVRGDVSAPTRIKSSTIANGVNYVFATRRRGDPSQVPFLLQAESMSLGTDTTTQANDPLFSGYVGNNYTRTTYATDATLVRRLAMFPYPVVSGNYGNTNWRGRYRVYARARHTVAGANLKFQLRFDGRDTGSTSLKNDEVLISSTSANLFFMVDLGTIQMPLGIDVPYDGPSGILNAAGGLSIGLYVQRVSGTGSTDIDFLIFVPADERYLQLRLGNDAFPDDTYVLDSYNDLVYPRDSGANATWSVAGSADDVLLGLLPELLPYETNRIYFFKTSTGGVGITGTETFQLSYWPRYLTLRGVST